MKVRLHYLVLAGLCLLLLPGVAKADVQFDLSTLINGSPPTSPVPWLTAVFHTVSTGTVELTMQNNMSQGEFDFDWLFNTTNPPSGTLTVTHTGGVNATFVDQSVLQTLNGTEHQGNVKGGLFNLEFTFSKNTSGRLGSGQTSTYTITGTNLVAESFLVKSIDDNGNPPSAGGWYSAADIRGIPVPGGGTTSGSIGTKDKFPPDSVPEPIFYQLSTLLVLGGLGALRLRKKRQE